jgi:hypothetical protein
MTISPSLRVIRSDIESAPQPHTVPSALHTTLAAVDISSFGNRDDHTQLHQRREMYALLAEACEITRIPWWDCYREDRGDGALIITPPHVPAEDLMDPFAHHLTAVLRRYNRLASASAGLRLRLAVHTGRIHHDAHGVTGQALIHLFRLLEATSFKRAFANAGTDLGLIVSGHLYADATSSSAFIDPDAYKPLRITCKETRTQAWAWFPPSRAGSAGQ